MNVPSTSSLPWLERLNLRIPGYQGYQQPSWRRQADETFRQALLHRLQATDASLRRSRQELEQREIRRERQSLDDLSRAVHRAEERVRQAPSFDPFLEAQAFGPARADTLHALDHALLESADRIRDLSGQAPTGHDWLAELRGQIDRFERELDARTGLLQQLI